MVIFHEAIGRVEYPFRGSNKSQYSIGESMCNNNFFYNINKNTGIVYSSVIIYGNCTFVTITIRSIFPAST